MHGLFFWIKTVHSEKKRTATANENYFLLGSKLSEKYETVGSRNFLSPDSLTWEQKRVQQSSMKVINAVGISIYFRQNKKEIF